MKPLLIIQTGHAFDELKQAQGDYDKFIIEKMPKALPIVTVDAIGGQLPDSPEEYSGVVLTGSHAMVSNKEEWSENTAQWLRTAKAADLPMLGICYGHQLLAHAFGGSSDYNPKGIEVGTKSLRTTPAATSDPLFDGVPETFLAHTTHSQSALTLPEDSTVLAHNDHDAHHAFRIGKHIWGVQFHPEFNTAVMRAYTHYQSPKLSDTNATLSAITETPDAERVLRRFGEYVLNHHR